MPSKKNPLPTKSLAVKLKVAFDRKPEQEIAVEAYAFDPHGTFLASAPVSGGTATLALTADQARRARLFFAPPLPEDQPQVTPTLKLMERLNAYEAVWRFNPEETVHALDPFPEIHWHHWRWCSCRVRGRVIRPVEIAGTTTELPVCHARVHICEVDRWPYLIARLPDPLVFRLRDELLLELERPIRWPRPLPDPPPFRFDPKILDPSPENLARQIQPEESRLIQDLDTTAINPQPEPPGALAIAPLASRAISPQPEPPAVTRAGNLTLEPALRAALISGSVPVVRQTLVDNVRLILPYLCHWPWLWWWFRCDELRVLETGPQGRFDTTLWYLCGGDHPDLYFWIEACIGGSWETVYRPPLPCNTYWNYACGSEVTLRVTDPRVPVCDEPPDLAGLQVAIMSIGDQVSIAEIQADGLITGGAPFGGVLEPHVWFSRGALIAAGVTHYRWSYRRRTDAEGNPVTDGWHALDRRVIRHYSLIDQTPPDFPLTFPSYPLGPDPAFGAQNLFQIQPVNVPVAPPPGSIITGWAPLNAREDSASAFFQTHLLSGGDAAVAAGKYELKFELFDNTGARVNLTARGILLKEATDAAPFSPDTVHTQIATNDHTLKDAAGDTVGFKIQVRVDNNPCEAEIYAINNAGLDVNTPCGFIRYVPGASAHLRFKAYHRNDFAHFRFETYRGPSIKVAPASAPDTPPLTGSAPVGPNPVNGFVPNAARMYSQWLPVNTLLTSNKPPGSPDCTSAAFAQTLYVWARATDGWKRLGYLDAQALPKAFAFAPKA